MPIHCAGSMLPGRFDLMPIRGVPSFERGKWFIERVPEIGEPVEDRGLNALRVHMAHDQSVSFGRRSVSVRTLWEIPPRAT